MDAPTFNATGLRSLALGGSAFYLRDGLMELWLAVMVDALAGDSAEWVRRMQRDMREQATIVFDGLLTAELDAHMSSASRVERFVSECRDVRDRLASGTFSPGPLAARIGGARWDSEMPPRLVRVTDAVLWLAANRA